MSAKQPDNIPNSYSVMYAPQRCQCCWHVCGRKTVVQLCSTCRRLAGPQDHQLRLSDTCIMTIQCVLMPNTKGGMSCHT